ncbi:MAG: MFS transporter [Chlamydiae bacterium]|nr:MFS transporter [Chlamydiota bacterium]
MIKNILSIRTIPFRWVITALIFLITLVNFIDRSAISFVVESLKLEFHFSDTQFGMILSAFGLGYVLLTSLGGWLVDRFGARLIWPIAAIAWSICFGLFGFAGGFGSFIVLRFLLGITEGPHFPAITRSVSDWLPPNERARALSISLVGIPLSSVIGAPITSFLVADFGWRTMFFAISAIGIVWAFIWYWLFRDNPQDSAFMKKEEKQFLSNSCTNKKYNTSQSSAIDWKFILFHPALLANNFAYFAFGYMLFFATLWLPKYFLSQHNLNLKAVGWYLVIPWLTAALFLKAGGILSDWLYKKTHSSRLARSHLIWSSQLLAAICFLILSYTHSLGFSLLFLSLGLGFGFMPQPAFFSVNIDVVKEHAGSAQGLTSSCLSLGGILAPVLTGWLIDLTGNFQGAFLLLAGFIGSATLVVIFFHHPDKKPLPSKLIKSPEEQS